MKRSDQILARAQVYASLAADGSVELSLHRGGNLDHVDASHVKRCEQTSCVAYNTTTERHDHSVSVRIQPRQLLGQHFDRSQLFVALAIKHFYELRFESRRR